MRGPVAGIEIIRGDVAAAPEHPVGGHHVVSARGSAAPECRLVSPAGFSLWLVDIELAAGGELHLPAIHGDEAIAVLSGRLQAGERICVPHGAVIVEAGAGEVVLRVLEDARIVHMGPSDPVVPTNGLNGTPLPGDAIHVVGPRGTYAAVEPGRDTHYFADSTCPTCRLTLLYTSRSREYVSETHSHSQDELIHLLWGELRLGSQVVRPGDTLAIAADRRYGFRSDEAGFGFLNYRRDASQQTVERGAPPRMEGGLVNGLEAVMDTA